MGASLTISLTQSQSDFYSLLENPEINHPLFVGGPGCGKSFILALCAVTLVQRGSGADVYVYAPQHHHIRTIEVPNIVYWLKQFKLKHGRFNKHENIIEIESPNCGHIYFKTMDDPTALVGYESYAALVDELDTLDEDKAEEIWKAVLKRNRKQPDDVNVAYRIWDERLNQLACANVGAAFTTPEGYRFCYKKWQLKPSEGYVQVKGCTLDNPKASSAYIQDVRDSHPPHVAEAYLRGEFVNMQSKSVYYNYDPALHASFETVRPGENVYIGCDFNVENTSAVVFVKRNGGKEWHAVDEFSEILDAATLAKLIHERYALKGHRVVMYPDSTGKSRSNANASISSLNELNSRGFIIRANSHNFLVEDRVNATNNAFLKSCLYINQEACPATHRCVMNQPNDKNGKPCKKTGYDHQNDAFSYPIVFELGLRPKLFNIPFSFAQKR